MGLANNIRHAWKTLRKGPEEYVPIDAGAGNSRPQHKSTTGFNISALSKVVYNRIATDAAMIPIEHVKVDSEGLVIASMKSFMNNCFKMEANIDQSSYQFMHDLVYSMCDEDAVAVVPTETDNRLNDSGSFDIMSMRVGKITQWYPKHVEIELYNEDTGRDERIVLPKRQVAILENPFLEIIGQSNSTLKRLKRKMALLDAFDEEVSSGKFNMWIQLPYTLKGSVKQAQAEKRRKDLEDQLKNNSYGIAYVGADEKVNQLNQPIENDLSDQVKYLQQEFFNQLGLTEKIFDGTANETEMNNYYARALEPVLTSIVQEFRRKFLTKTARSQGQDIIFTRNIFKLAPVEQLANIAETLSRNAIATPNELRPMIGLKKSMNPVSDELFNRNISDKNQVTPTSVDPAVADSAPAVETNNQNGGSLSDTYFN